MCISAPVHLAAAGRVSHAPDMSLSQQEVTTKVCDARMCVYCVCDTACVCVCVCVCARVCVCRGRVIYSPCP